MKVLKQILGIDVAKDELVVSPGKLMDDLSSEIKDHQVFDNTEKGFESLYVELLSSIPGVGKATAIAVLAETNGFELIRNKRQLTSYAGLDIREKQSGTSVKSKPRISKKGNKNLRKTLHFPSMTAVKMNQEHCGLFHRIVSKTGIKMKGLVAVQRKLLELMYVLFKNKTHYQGNYEENRAENQKKSHPTLADSRSL